ncbi:MAG: hypothetical protein H7338_18270 [Candidatus Sericytochromatia bacterium]|nr:hypothetical protein [Candidatus Sericytochromatia bacterium]
MAGPSFRPSQPVQGRNEAAAVQQKAPQQTEKSTTQNQNTPQAKANIDGPMYKAEVAKQTATQKDQTPAGQTQTHHSSEQSRQVIDPRPPGEDKAQFKDEYNPASTILRGQEMEQQQKEEKLRRDSKKENGGKQRRQYVPTAAPKSRITAPIKGADVLGGQTSDMFMPSAAEMQVHVNEKTLVEQMREYNMGAAGAAMYTAVSANADKTVETGVGANLQKVVLSQIAESLAETPDVMSAEYRQVVRELVQGALRAAQDKEIKVHEVIKMVFVGLMAISPHAEDTKIMTECAKVISAEILLGKINIGYTMKAASYALGGALFMLSVYFKNYQSKLDFSKDLDQKIKYAINEGIWEATGEITGFSESHARANTDRFVSGRVDEEKDFQATLVQGIVLNPLRKLEKMGFLPKFLRGR